MLKIISSQLVQHIDAPQRLGVVHKGDPAWSPSLPISNREEFSERLLPGPFDAWITAAEYPFIKDDAQLDPTTVNDTELEDFDDFHERRRPVFVEEIMSDSPVTFQSGRQLSILPDFPQPFPASPPDDQFLVDWSPEDHSARVDNLLVNVITHGRHIDEKFNLDHEILMEDESEDMYMDDLILDDS